MHKFIDMLISEMGQDFKPLGLTHLLLNDVIENLLVNFQLES